MPQHTLRLTLALSLLITAAPLVYAQPSPPPSAQPTATEPSLPPPLPIPNSSAPTFPTPTTSENKKDLPFPPPLPQTTTPSPSLPEIPTEPPCPPQDLNPPTLHFPSLQPNPDRPSLTLNLKIPTKCITAISNIPDWLTIRRQSQSLILSYNTEDVPPSLSSFSLSLTDTQRNTATLSILLQPPTTSTANQTSTPNPTKPPKKLKKTKKPLPSQPLP